MIAGNGFPDSQTLSDESALELWGGVECTRNRVQGDYFDQVARSGHDRRIDDLYRIALLGIKTLRYPVLWEWAALSRGNYDWTWADERLPTLRSIGIKPIAGLVHHGSGPPHTSLIDASFVDGLASFAGALAERFPWLQDFTPVNEPLTTARFSCLYGHWYPHARDPLLFATAMLVQCRAVIEAMRAVRKVRPDARLVQTEDLGTTYCSPSLQYQADFDNARRWLTFDLLCGKVDGHDPIGNYFLWLGVKPDELKWFRDNPCPADIIGVNHYVTSDRYLDERVENYAVERRGGNGRHVYADVEAVRVMEDRPPLSALLEQTWERYGFPIAITEAHIAGWREDQVRWLWEIWQQAEAAQRAGADVRAVTVWSLLGAFDWDKLVTSQNGYYEPGAFDVRGDSPRPTAVAELVRHVARRRASSMSILRQPGWWRRPERLNANNARRASSLDGPPILITGGRGTLARAFATICEQRAIPFFLLARSGLDIADRESVVTALQQFKPWAIVNAAGYVRVDDAENDREKCYRENVVGPAVLAAHCRRRGIRLVSFSSDLVFDGEQNKPYRETDRANPMNVYGWTKAEAEREIIEAHAGALIVRTSSFFGPWDQYNFVSQVLAAVGEGRDFHASAEVVSPTYVPDLAHACLDLLVDNERGIWHLTNDGETSWIDLAHTIALRGGFGTESIRPLEAAGHFRPARRPAYSALGTNHGLRMRSLDEALDRYFHDRPDIRLELNSHRELSVSVASE